MNQPSNLQCTGIDHQTPHQPLPGPVTYTPLAVISQVSGTALERGMWSGQELLSQQLHTMETESPFFNLSVLRGQRETTTVAILKDRLLEKLMVQMNGRTLWQ